VAGEPLTVQLQRGRRAGISRSTSVQSEKISRLWAEMQNETSNIFTTYFILIFLLFLLWLLYTGFN
jgi:preprotein translocase subunit SecG